MVSENKKRYYLSLNTDVAEDAQEVAKELGLTFSQYVNLLLKSCNQKSFDGSFSVFVDSLSALQENSRRTSQSGKKPKNLPKMIYTGEG